MKHNWLLFSLVSFGLVVDSVADSVSTRSDVTTMTVPKGSQGSWGRGCSTSTTPIQQFDSSEGTTRVITGRAARYEEELRQLFVGHFTALQAEKIDEALLIYGTMEDDVRKKKHAEYKKLFSEHQLTYGIDRFKVASATSRSARVELELHTTNSGQSAFRSNRARMSYMLERREKVWRLVSQKVERVRYAKR